MRPNPLDDLPHHPLGVVFLGDVPPDRHGPSAGLRDLPHDLFGSPFVRIRQVVDPDRGPLPAQTQRDRPSDPAGGPRYERRLAF